MTVLQTERLILRYLQQTDAPFMVQLLNDPSWIKYIGDRGVRTIEQAEAYLQAGPMASYAQHGFGLYLVERDGVPMGMCGLVKRDQLTDVDVGFAFLPQFTGQGYAYEAATAVIHHAQTHLNLSRLVAITASENGRSQRLLQKLGFQFEKMVDWSAEEQVMLFGL